MNQKTANHVESLRGKNRELDTQILAEQQRPLPDSLLLKSLKTQKCSNRTEIARLTGEFAAHVPVAEHAPNDDMVFPGFAGESSTFAFEQAMAHEDSFSSPPPAASMPVQVRAAA